MMFNVVMIVLESMATHKFMSCEHNGVMLLGDADKFLHNNGCIIKQWETVIALGIGEPTELTSVNFIDGSVRKFFITRIN